MSNNKFQSQLDNINKSFQLILEEYYRTYPLSKLNPENQDIFNIVSKDTNNLKLNESNLFELKNMIEKNINDLNTDMTLKNKQIIEIKKANEKLEKELLLLKNGNNAAVGQLDDITTKFYDNFTFYFGLLAVSLFLGYLIYKKYKYYE
jgi:hypothetical protein